MTAKKKVGRIAHTAAVAASQRVIDVQNALHELLQRCVGQLAASRFGSGEEKAVMTDLTATKRHLEGGEGRGGEIRFEEKGHGGFEAVIHGETVGFLKIRKGGGVDTLGVLSMGVERFLELWEKGEKEGVR